MRLLFLTFLQVVLFAAAAPCQNEPTFTVQIAKNEVPLGEWFEVKFILENGSNATFIPPDWEAAGFIAGNTSQSSSFSLSNGRSSASAIYKFELMARDTGVWEIPVATVKIPGMPDLKSPIQNIHVTPGTGKEKEWLNPPRDPAKPGSAPKKKIKTIRL